MSWKVGQMAGERLRIPIDPKYEAALGRFLFAFARLHWAAAWCIDSFGDMRIGQIVNNFRTAGPVAGKLKAVAKRLPPGPRKPDFVELSEDFSTLVRDFRNNVLHATPATVQEKQLLVKVGRVWTLSEIEEAADKIARVEIGLNDFFHAPPLGWKTSTAALGHQ